MNAKIASVNTVSMPEPDRDITMITARKTVEAGGKILPNISLYEMERSVSVILEIE